MSLKKTVLVLSIIFAVVQSTPARAQDSTFPLTATGTLLGCTLGGIAGLLAGGYSSLWGPGGCAIGAAALGAGGYALGHYLDEKAFEKTYEYCSRTGQDGSWGARRGAGRGGAITVYDQRGWCGVDSGWCQAEKGRCRTDQGNRVGSYCRRETAEFWWEHGGYKSTSHYSCYDNKHRKWVAASESDITFYGSRKVKLPSCDFTLRFATSSEYYCLGPYSPYQYDNHSKDYCYIDASTKAVSCASSKTAAQNACLGDRINDANRNEICLRLGHSQPAPTSPSTSAAPTMAPPTEVPVPSEPPPPAPPTAAPAPIVSPSLPPQGPPAAIRGPIDTQSPSTTLQAR